MKAKFVLDKETLMRKYQQLQEKCDIVSYSLKTNQVVGKVLENTGCWYSVHSLESARMVPAERVLFFAQGLTADLVKEVLLQGVKRFVVDNVNDLRVLLTFLESSDEKITLFLRMKLKEHSIHTGKHFVFGIGAREVNNIVQDIKEHKNIEKLGVHFHRKTQNIHDWSLHFELKDSLTEETLNAIDYLNMGGGIPVRYKNSRDRLEHIFNEIRMLREWLAEKGVKMIIEPGRFIAAPCITLHTEIVNVYGNTVIVNASVYNSAMDTFIANVRLEVEGELEKGKGYTVKGCTPDSIDIFRYRVFLDEPKVGDKIIFLNAGAYTFHSEFCMLEKLETEVI